MYRFIRAKPNAVAAPPITKHAIIMVTTRTIMAWSLSTIRNSTWIVFAAGRAHMLSVMRPDKMFAAIRITLRLRIRMLSVATRHFFNNYVAQFQRVLACAWRSTANLEGICWTTNAATIGFGGLNLRRSPVVENTLFNIFKGPHIFPVDARRRWIAFWGASPTPRWIAQKFEIIDIRPVLFWACHVPTKISTGSTPPPTPRDVDLKNVKLLFII